MIAERFERMGWEIYKSKARCPDCTKARRRQKHHFAQKNESEAKRRAEQAAISIKRASDTQKTKAEEEATKVQTIRTHTDPINVTRDSRPMDTHKPQIVRPQPPSPAPATVAQQPRPQPPEPISVPPPEPRDIEIVRSYLMNVNSDGSVDVRELDAAKEMLFGNQTYLVIPR